jgi:hypothetical protein
MKATWERRQTYKNKPFWVWDKYEISKISRPDDYKTTGYKLINIDHPKLIEIYDTLEIAKGHAYRQCWPKWKGEKNVYRRFRL